MTNILKTLACVVTLAVGFATAAHADDAWLKWASTMQYEIDNNKVAVDKMGKEFRDVRCPPQKTPELKAACISMYNTVIALMNVKRDQLEIKQLAASLLPSQRDKIIQKASASYDELDRQAASLADQAYLQFPIPNQSSQR